MSIFCARFLPLDVAERLPLSAAAVDAPYPPRRMYDLSRFSLSDMTRCGMELRRLGQSASSMEEVANETVRALYEKLRAPEMDRPACALVRMFVTLPYAELQPAQQSFVRDLVGEEPDASLKCLTLMATAGEVAAWNSRHSSVGHQAIPLSSADAVARSPMIAQLLRQLGVEIHALLAPDPDFLLEADQHTFNVFHVPEAVDSPYIPAQREFVIRFGIRSVLGFGGLLPTGELFATILFSRASIPREVADLFKTLALNVKVALLPFVGARMFE